MSALAEALVAALAELTGVEKGKTAKVKMKQGGEYTYTYADIADVIAVTRPALHEHGIVALTPVHGYEDGLACTVRLIHTSGETMEFPPLPFPHGADAQATGSAITYHRRYALLAALGMAAEDDDGAAAKERPAERSDRPTRQSSSSAAGPTEPQRKLIHSLSGGDVALVASICQEVHGSEIDLDDLPRREVSKVIDELKAIRKGQDRETAARQADKAAAVEAGVASGEEPF